MIQRIETYRLVSSTLVQLALASPLPREMSILASGQDVNEVGHGKIEQNVFIALRCDVVQYIFATKTINAGDRVELLANYGPNYEKIRRRLGYGLKNLSGIVLSCH
jgi:hypothetical protein